jgi:hypothetical protein
MKQLRGFLFTRWFHILNRGPMNLRSSFRLFGFLFLVAGSGFAQTVGALGNGTSSRATSLGGATVATITSPLEAMQSNPAGLAN